MHDLLIFKNYLKNEQECFIRSVLLRARSASGFRPNKTRPASFLNGFKNSLKIHEENTKKNHKRVVSLYVDKDFPSFT